MQNAGNEIGSPGKGEPMPNDKVTDESISQCSTPSSACQDHEGEIRNSVSGLLSCVRAFSWCDIFQLYAIELVKLRSWAFGDRPKPERIVLDVKARTVAEIEGELTAAEADCLERAAIAAEGASRSLRFIRRGVRYIIRHREGMEEFRREYDIEVKKAWAQLGVRFDEGGLHDGAA